MMNASGEFESFDENERRYPMSSVFVETGAMPALELEVLFVKGLPVLLTSNYGDISWKLTNNRRGTFHSFKYKDEVVQNWVRETLTLCKINGGDIINIPQPRRIFWCK